LREAKTIRLLLPLLKMYPWGLPATVVLGTLSSLAEGIGLSLFVPLLQSLAGGAYQSEAGSSVHGIINRFLGKLPSDNRLHFIVAAILAMTVCKGLLTYAHSALAAAVNAGITHAIRVRLFAKMITLDHGRLEDMESGRLLNLLATDTWHASDAISLLTGLVVNVCSVLVFSVLLVMLSPGLSAIVVLGVSAILIALQGLTGGARKLGRQGVEMNAALTGQMLDGLGGIDVIQMFGLETYRRRIFEAVSEHVRSIYLRLDLLHRAMPPISEILYIGLLLGVLLIGVSAKNSVATVVVFLLVLYRLQPQIRQFDSGRLSLIALTSSIEDVTRFLVPIYLCEPLPACPAKAFQSEIYFDGVSFSYGSEDCFALRDLCFRIPYGKTTALLGVSGSGKSTLISLLCRFREPTCGEIRVDGRLLKGLDRQDWRRQIAWAGQNTYLFSESVRENIRYGNLDASDDEIIAAAIEADADCFIRTLPDGYETKIGNSGLTLSGGQRQRIGLARALLRDPGILILDEATSALDSFSEASIQQFLRKKAGRWTVLVISHRLSTVRHADQVIVLSGGRITEQGPPDELLGRRGFFYKLRELQHVE
jgi:subfamily B ATP-binding cassette protein MsbA